MRTQKWKNQERRLNIQGIIRFKTGGRTVDNKSIRREIDGYIKELVH